MIAARQVLSTFDIKPSATTADSELDELMIDWRSLPAGAIAPDLLGPNIHHGAARPYPARASN
jgi:hypothetical protein